jgi:hypothetical protein
MPESMLETTGRKVTNNTKMAKSSLTRRLNTEIYFVIMLVNPAVYKDQKNSREIH